MADNDVSINPNDFCGVRRLDTVEQRDAKEMVALSFEDATLSLIPPDVIDHKARLDIGFRPICLFSAIENEIVNKLGCRAINHLVARSWGRMLLDDRLREHEAALRDIGEAYKGASENEQAALVAPRFYRLSCGIVAKARMRPNSWDVGVAKGIGSIALRNRLHATTISIVYMSIDLLCGGLDIGSTATKVFKREEESWYDWLAYDTRNLKRLM